MVGTCRLLSSIVTYGPLTEKSRSLLPLIENIMPNELEKEQWKMQETVIDASEQLHFYNCTFAKKRRRR